MRTSKPLLFLIVFALLQGMLPLLHVHVNPAAHAESGIHFHAAPLAAALPGDGLQVANAAIGESPAITAPTEHRRDEPAFDARFGSAAPGFEVAALQSLPAMAIGFATALVAATALRTRPPTRAPPAFS